MPSAYLLSLEVNQSSRTNDWDEASYGAIAGALSRDQLLLLCARLPIGTRACMIGAGSVCLHPRGGASAQAKKDEWRLVRRLEDRAGYNYMSLSVLRLPDLSGTISVQQPSFNLPLPV
jgi:hypothetical protein